MKKTLLQFIMIIPLIILLCFSFSCKQFEKAAEEAPPAVDIEAEKATVKSVLDQWIQAFETEDIELLSKIIAHDDDIIIFGTDAAEHWIGWEPMIEAQKRFFESTEESDISIRDQVIKVHKSAEVAWFSELMDWNGVIQGEPFSFEGIRLTGVMEKRNGNWVIVQFHCSVPVSGQAIKY